MAGAGAALNAGADGSTILFAGAAPLGAGGSVNELGDGTPLGAGGSIIFPGEGVCAWNSDALNPGGCVLPFDGGGALGGVVLLPCAGRSVVLPGEDCGVNAVGIPPPVACCCCRGRSPPPLGTTRLSCCESGEVPPSPVGRAPENAVPSTVSGRRLAEAALLCSSG